MALDNAFLKAFLRRSDAPAGMVPVSIEQAPSDPPNLDYVVVKFARVSGRSTRGQVYTWKGLLSKLNQKALRENSRRTALSRSDIGRNFL